MNRSFVILLTLCIFSLPFFVYADTSLDDIGANPGSDFYSRIDDRGDALTVRLVQTRVRQYGTFGPLGCGVSWLDKEPMDQLLLDEVSIGRYDRIMTIATRNGSAVSLSTPEFSRITQCLSEKYATIIQHASISQDAIETVATTGLYADGDTRNSDYDIISDIQRINTIVFKDQNRYTGVQNNTSTKIRDFIAGQKIAPLFGVQPRSGSPVSTDVPATTTPAPSWGSGEPSWAASCSLSGSGAGNLFDSTFYTDLSTTIGGGRSSGGGVVYTPPSLAWTTPSGVLFAGDKEDFFHTPPCNDAFCIRINQVPTSTQMLGSWKNNAIESLLEKHIKMMQPISESDLSCNIMQSESFANNDSRKKFADQVSGGQMFIVKKNQQTRTYKTDDTQTARDADLMAAYSCAMSEAGLVADKDLINGMNGMGYRLLTSMNLTNTTQTELPGGATPTQNLQWCYQIRMNQPKTALESSLIPDLDELQAMTRSMTEILSHILDADTRLDTLWNCK